MYIKKLEQMKRSCHDQLRSRNFEIPREYVQNDKQRNVSQKVPFQTFIPNGGLLSGAIGCIAPQHCTLICSVTPHA